ncbi:hypothetical protein VPNG_03465 [Cytospora leucostoma]|uniref:Small secreted protein n=1 Tax=Cytospora leucostoma TaxID=1230097 RepID=A0A423XFK5_9PEZI|nr:hypothetical protein VPNG_03465 [Cytospora leucostoma]
MELIRIMTVVAILASATAALNLNITAIGASNGSSTLECWQLEEAFSVSSVPGVTGSASALLGDTANITVTVLPAAFDGGLHNAPLNQWVAFVSGLAHISLPNNASSNAYVEGGEFGLIFASDTADLSTKGHRTVYPGNTETVALIIPTKDGLVPNHTTVHNGPCTADDGIGLRGLSIASE